MASAFKDKSRNGYRIQVYVRSVRRVLWLGPVAKSSAVAVAAHLDAINVARDTGTIIPAESRRWISAISPRIRNRLSAWGLIDSQAATNQTARTLGPYLQSYIDGRTDWSPRTKSRMHLVRRRLVQQLGHDTALAAITPGDAQRFARWARTQGSSSHTGKTIADARQLFRAAIADRILADNPFAGIDTSQAHDTARSAYVSPSVVQSLIELADPYYAALISLARFGGLRVPSEPLQLRWQDVNFATGRLLVTSPKLIHHTPTRSIPLFPEIRPHLQTLYDLSPDGSTYAFTRYRGTAAKVYRSTLERLLKRANIKPWPKLWMNLRASCRTDLLERFPSHVVNAWLGHSAKIGSKHYDRVHDGHYAEASGVVLPVESSSRIPPPSPALENEKSLGNRGFPKASCGE